MRAPLRFTLAAAALLSIAVAAASRVALTAAETPAAPRADSLDPTRRISQYVHTAWRIQDGVLPNLPLAFAQTSDGYLWIGTFGGLVRFDGVDFVSWEGSDEQSLPDSRIVSLLGSSDGSLWIGTPVGVARLKDGKLTVLSKLGGRANTIIEGHDGRIWIGRIDVQDERGGICEVVGDELKFYGASEGVPFRSVNQLAEGPDGTLWVASYQGLCQWSPTSLTGSVEKLETGGLLGAWDLTVENDGTVWAAAENAKGDLELQRRDQQGWKRHQLPGVAGETGVTALYVDRDQCVWIGTARLGIFRIHAGEVDHFDSGDGLSGDAVAGFFEDREGSLWVGTSKGVDRFRDVRVATFSIREGLNTDSVSSVLATRDGRVWIGNSGALNLLENGKLSAIRTGEGLPGRDVTTLFEDRAGRLWVGVDDGLWLYEGGRFRLIDKGIAFAVTEDTDGVVWARIGKRLDRIVDLQVRDTVDLPFVPSAYKMAADPAGGVWFGLNNGDLVRYRNGQTETVPAIHESRSAIRALVVDPDGSVWASTQDGLLRWKDGTARLLTSTDGLPCDEVYAIVNDGIGSLWLYVKCGVVSLSMEELDDWWATPGARVNARLFDPFDGAHPSLSPKQPIGARSTDGRIWFVNDSLLQMIDPNRLVTNRIPPPVHIQRVVADRRRYPETGSLKFPALTRDVEIDYAALSLSVPQKVRYRYRLDGHDLDWQDAGTRREAFYNDLPPGTYTFRVIACNNDGVWNEHGATIEFVIAPAFYQTFWFVLLCIAVTSLLVWAAYRWRVRWISAQLDRRFEERLAERTRIAQDLHDTLLQGVLSASLQLHVAHDQIPDDAPGKPLVRRVLELMGHVVDEGRNALRGLRSSDEDPEDLNLAFTRVPKEIAADRAVAFRVLVEGRSQALHPMIRDEIYRIGREAIINAFRHAAAKHIEVDLRYGPNDLRLTVRDDGRGIDAAVLRSGRDGHFGLAGMKERSERIGAKLKVLSRASSGTEVELSIPGSAAFRAHHPRRRRSRT